MHKGTFIYCAAEDSSHLVKIGMASDPVKRIRLLQTANGRDIKLVAAFPGGYAEEIAIRFAWGHLHVRGEWHVDEGRQISRFFRLRAATLERLSRSGSVPSVAIAIKCPKGMKASNGVGRPKQYLANSADEALWRNVKKYKTDAAAAAQIGVSISTLRRTYQASGRAKIGRPKKSK